jgi:hypothetical protein
MCPFDAALHTGQGRPVMQPVLRLFNLGQGQRILAAGERTVLEGLETINDDREQRLVRQAVNPDLGDGAVLEAK